MATTFAILPEQADTPGYIPPAPPTQGFVPTIDVGPRYDPSIPAGQPGSELTPSLVSPGGKGDVPTQRPGEGKTTTFTILPDAPPGPPQAATAPLSTAPMPGPPQPPQAAPDPSQGVGAALVPMLPQGASAPPQPSQGLGGQLVPQMPQMPRQQPVGPPPAPIQYSVMGHNIPTSITHPVDVFGNAVGQGLLGLGFGGADLVNQGLRQVGLGLYKPWGGLELMNRTLDPTGAMQPTTESERWLANVGGAVGGGIPFLPLAAAGGVGQLLAREGLSALGSGSAQTLAQNVDAGPAAQFAAALLGGGAGRGIYNVAKGLGAAAETGTEAGRQAIAGARLAGASSSPETLATRLATNPPVGLPTAQRTTAMAAGVDPALAQVEHAVYATPEGGRRLRAVEAQRNEEIATALRGLRTPTPGTAAGRGADIRASAQAQERTMLGEVNRQYTAARAAPGTTSLRPVINDIARITGERFGAGSAGAPAAWRRVAGQITQRVGTGAPVNATWLMNMSRQLGDEAREAFRAGRNTEGEAYRQLQRAVDRLSPNPTFTAARNYRAQVGRLTGRDATGSHAMGDVLGTDKFGMPKVTDDRVTGRILSQGPGGVRQMLDAADEAVRVAPAGAGRAAMQVARVRLTGHLRDAFIDEAERQRTAAPTPAMTAAGVSTTSPTFSQAKWSNFWRQNQGVARQLFSPAHLDTLERIGRQLDETAAVAAAGRAKGSDTAQILMAAGKEDNPSLAHVLSAMTQGRSTPGSLSARMTLFAVNKLPLAAAYHLHGGVGALAAHLLGADHITDVIFKNSDAAIKAMLHNAASDPQFASQLVRRATERGLLDAANRSRATGGAFWQFLRLAARPAAAASAAAAGASRPPLP